METNKEIEKKVEKILREKSLKKNLKDIKSNRDFALGAGITFLIIAIFMLGMTFSVVIFKDEIEKSLRGEVDFNEKLNNTFRFQNVAIFVTLTVGLIFTVTGFVILAYAPTKEFLNKLEEVIEIEE